MSKTVGKVLAFAAIAVTVIAAIPTAGASLGLTAGLLSAIGAGLAVASLVNSELLAAKMKGQLQARQASVLALQLGEVAREMVIGLALTAGSLVDAFNYGGTYGTDWECLVLALADHECDGLVGFYVNDQYVAYTGDGAVACYNGQLEIYWLSGTMTQSVPAVVLANGPSWTANDRGKGVCWVAVCYKADKADAKNPIWTAGRPSFAWLLRGKKCYQPRLDSTVGGFGAHRWSDPTTWSWTDNPIDCRYAWVRGTYAGNQVDQPGQLLAGRGLSDLEAPPANVFAPANICDELVALDAGGAEKRYRVNGVIRADETFIEIEEHFAAACGGLIYQPEGAVEIEPGHAKSPVFFFSDDELITGSTVEFSDDLPETDAAWVNTVVPRYVEPTLKYADHAAPIRRIAADLVADGGPREQGLSLAFVTSGTQAGRIGEIARRLGRLLRRGKVTLGPEFAEIEEGDWCVWTSQRYLQGASVVFRVEAYGLDEKWQNTLVLREISTACYARDSDAASGSVALQQAVPSIGAPGAGAWTLASGATDAAPALIVTGAADNSFAELVRFEYLPAAGVTDPAAASGWRDDGAAGPDVKRREIASVLASTSYYVGVSYIVGRVPGPRRIIGPVTTSALVAGPKGDKGDDGVSAYALLLSNEDHILPAAADGTVLTYNGAATDVVVYYNGADVTANFALSVASNPQALAVTISGHTATVTGGLDPSEPNAILLLQLTGGGAFAGTTLTRQFSLTKSRAGADGASAKLIYIASTHQTISLDAAGNVTPQTITFTVNRQNPGAGQTSWRYLDADGTPRTAFTSAATQASALGASTTGNDNLSITAAQLYAHMAYSGSSGGIFEVRLDNDPSIADRISIVQVRAGANGAAGTNGTNGINGTNGLNGTNGAPGAPGANGQTSYVHVAYADSLDGSANFTSGAPGARKFIGIRTDYTFADSENYADYTWSKLTGDNGVNGANGTAGANGYAHFAYADSADGTVNFSTTTAGTRTYIGTYTDNVEPDSTNPAVYAWSLIKGADGAPGAPGVSPAPAYPAVSVTARGYTAYPSVVPLAAGQTLSFATKIHAYNPSSGAEPTPGSVTIQGQYSTNGGASWNVIGSTFSSVGAGVEKDVTSFGSYTNSSGAGQTVSLRVFIATGGEGGDNLGLSVGYGQPS